MFTPSPTFEWRVPGCPEPPYWTLDWSATTRAFPDLFALGDVQQEPAHHGEGDVLTHTRMVCKALAAISRWRALPPVERRALFAAAVLHDISKGRCTVVDEQGHISAPGHARAGAHDTQVLLWQDHELPLMPREHIVRLVRHHGLPLWFWDREDMARAVIAASQVVRLDHIALLAEADVRGRVCADQQELLDRVALFHEFCADLGCLDAPYQFTSDHSRVVYFEGAPSPYTAYDDTRCEVMLMSGIPGAGKDTWLAHNYPDLPVISLDRLRAELDIAPTDNQRVVVHAAKEQAKVFLRAHSSFVWNATNVTHTMRAQLIDLFRRYHARVTIVYVDAAWRDIVERNRQREHGIPLAALHSLARKLDVPDLTEAHKVHWVVPDERLENVEAAVYSTQGSSGTG
jgi:predicted kinase